MMKGRWLEYFLCGTIACALVGCGAKPEPSEETAGDSNVEIVFSLELDQQVYWDSDWGDPPQIAIWLQNKNNGQVRTVMVTHRTGRGDWEGKPQCPVSLPYWVAFYTEETGTKGPPTWKEPAADGVTRATPQEELTVRVAVPAGSEWVYFIEINCSGDFNDRYPSFSDEGVRDDYGNGQPSLVYRGELQATPGTSGQPQLVGRTHQHVAVGKLVTDLDSITTARGLFRSLRVTCE
jgi:hypothetical protein